MFKFKVRLLQKGKWGGKQKTSWKWRGKRPGMVQLRSSSLAYDLGPKVLFIFVKNLHTNQFTWCFYAIRQPEKTPSSQVLNKAGKVIECYGTHPKALKTGDELKSESCSILSQVLSVPILLLFRCWDLPGGWTRRFFPSYGHRNGPGGEWSADRSLHFCKWPWEFILMKADSLFCLACKIGEPRKNSGLLY